MSANSSPPEEDELSPLDPTGVRMLPDADAQDWGSQMRNAVRSVQGLRGKLELSPE
jgi:hypothetical protein